MVVMVGGGGRLGAGGSGMALVRSGNCYRCSAWGRAKESSSSVSALVSGAVVLSSGSNV